MNILINSLEGLIAFRDTLELHISAYMEQRESLFKDIYNGPKEVKGLDTTQESVQTSKNFNFLDGIKNIDAINSSKMLKDLYDELEKTNQRIEEIGQAMERLEGLEEKVFYWRRVKGLTQEQTAEKLGISDRHVRRIEEKIRESA